MRTARTLTVCPKEILEKKNLRPPEKLEAPPPKNDRMTDACKNITLPETSLWAVNITLRNLTNYLLFQGS